MKRAVLLLGTLAAIAIVHPGCSKPRGGFESAPGGSFAEDAGAPPEVNACPLQCSMDLRSVVRSCDGAVIETCPPSLACGDIGCTDPCAAAAHAQGSAGCEFFMLPPPTDRMLAARSCYAAYVVNTQPTPADLRIEYRGEPADLSGAVFSFAAGTGDLSRHDGPLEPGEGVVIFLADPPDKTGAEAQIFCPAGVKPVTTDWPVPMEFGFGRGSAFRLVTSVPVTASTIYPFGGARSYMTSATLLLPAAGWGKQHVLIGAWQRIAVSGQKPSFPGMQIVAAHDDTEVTIRPTVNIVDGKGADVDLKGTLEGTPKTYTLSRGQALQIMQLEDPSGSLVESNKPTALFGGHSCMNIPSVRGREHCCCDADQKQLPAFEQWGHEYAVVGHRPRIGSGFESSPYRIVSAVDDTILFYDPAPPGGAPRRMSAGQSALFWTSEPFVVRTQDADHPIYVAQYMTGSSMVGLQGDPEFVNVVPAGQYLGSYAFYADPTYAETSLVVVREKHGAAFEDVRLECAGGNIPDFKPIGTEARFEYAHVDLVRDRRPVAVLPGGPLCGYGLQELQSGGPFTATIWGWDAAVSYAYPGGMGQRKLVTKPLVVF